MADDDNTPIAQLREAAERGKTAEREAEAAKRENAFLKAGIDVDDPRAKYFVRGYDGELTKEAIITEATAAGVLGAPTPEPEPEPEGSPRRQPSEDEVAQDDLHAQVGAGAAPPGEPPQRDEMEVGWERFRERRKTEPVQEAAAEVLGRMLDLGVKGDPRYRIGDQK